MPVCAEHLRPARSTRPQQIADVAVRWVVNVDAPLPGSCRVFRLAEAHTTTGGTGGVRVDAGGTRC